MHINPIKSTTLNFGYNKQFHKEIQNNLARKGKSEANFLIKKDKKLIMQEEKIMLLEILGFSNTKKYKELCDSYVMFKKDLADDMDSYDFTLRYSESLAKTYRIEASRMPEKPQMEWRRRLSALLQKSANAKKEEYKQKFFSFMQESSAPAKSTKKQEENADISSLIPLYKPNQYSPKGLSDVIGSSEIKEKLNDDLIPYAICPEQIDTDFDDYGLRAPRGFLFYGPPGCGKTFMTQAIANQTGLPMFTMDVSKIGSMWVNKTSNNIREAFEYIFKQADNSDKPLILFMDEVDTLAMERTGSSSSQENSKALTTLLKMVEISRDNNVIIIAATNKYDLLDLAFKDRFDGQIYFPLPDEEQIENLLTATLVSRKKGLALGYEEDKIKELTKMLKGFSNRAIVMLVDDAAKLARRRNRDDIRFEDMVQAIEETEHKKIKESDYKQEDKKSKIGF